MSVAAQPFYDVIDDRTLQVRQSTQQAYSRVRFWVWRSGFWNWIPVMSKI